MAAFIIPTEFTAIDRVTSVVERINRAINQTNNRVEAFNKRFEAIDKISKKVAIGAAVVGTAITAPIALATREAIRFEDKMADVAKVMNLSAGSKELAKINDEVKDLAIHLAQTPEATAELYANIAQSGVAANEIKRVSQLAGEMGVAYGIAAGQAGESFVKMQNAMGATIDQTVVITDAINHLGNNTASKSAELLEFMAAGGAGAARTLNIAGKDAAAFGSVLIANGKSAAEAGTIFERMMKGILNNANMKSIFDKAGGGLTGLMAIFEKSSKLSKDQQFQFFSKFGQYGTDISMYSKNLDQLKDTLEKVRNETDFAGSSHDEFANRQQTMAVQLEKLKTQFTILAIEIGQVVLPLLGDLVSKISPIITSVKDWMKENQGLTKGIVYTALTLGGIAFVISGLAGLIQGIITIYKAWIFVQGLLNTAMRNNPMGLIITLIGVLVAAIVWLISKTKGFGEQWQEIWEFIKAAFMAHTSFLKLGFLGIVDAFASMAEAVAKAWYWLQNKMGIMSDESYSQELARIESEKNARIDAIRDTHAEMMKYTDRVSQGIEWKLRWSDAQQPGGYTPSGFAPWESNMEVKQAYMPVAAMSMQQYQQYQQEQKNTLEVIVKSDKGENVSIGRNSGDIPVKLGTTFTGLYNR